MMKSSKAKTSPRAEEGQAAIQMYRVVFNVSLSLPASRRVRPHMRGVVKARLLMDGLQRKY